uniref:Uncharacterized protein n=1 Tax=Ditylenchus dipsaci TaxID=166011 RepID=A0A915DAN6_9BILA
MLLKFSTVIISLPLLLLHLHLVLHLQFLYPLVHPPPRLHPRLHPHILPQPRLLPRQLLHLPSFPAPFLLLFLPLCHRSLCLCSSRTPTLLPCLHPLPDLRPLIPRLHQHTLHLLHQLLPDFSPLS